jgi:hypothetical protein
VRAVPAANAAWAPTRGRMPASRRTGAPAPAPGARDGRGAGAPGAGAAARATRRRSGPPGRRCSAARGLPRGRRPPRWRGARAGAGRARDGAVSSGLERWLPIWRQNRVGPLSPPNAPPGLWAPRGGGAGPRDLGGLASASRAPSGPRAARGRECGGGGGFGGPGRAPPPPPPRRPPPHPRPHPPPSPPPRLALHDPSPAPAPHPHARPLATRHANTKGGQVTCAARAAITRESSNGARAPPPRGGAAQGERGGGTQAAPAGQG